MLPIFKWWPRLHLVKEVWMVAYFFQLHKNVKKFDFFTNAINHIDIASEDVLI